MTQKAQPSKRIATPKERQERNRQEMTTAILDTAREVMREQGVTALNLSEIARRLGITTPAIYSYFSSKDALYDALFHMAIRLFREDEEKIWRTSNPDWERIEAWFNSRLTLASQHPDLYHLAFDAPVPSFAPSQESREEIRQTLEAARRGMTEVVEAGVIDPGMPTDRALDILLSLRRGIVAEHLGKEVDLALVSNRFAGLIPDAIAMLRVAWAPRQPTPD